MNFVRFRLIDCHYRHVGICVQRLKLKFCTSVWADFFHKNLLNLYFQIYLNQRRLPYVHCSDHVRRNSLTHYTSVSCMSGRTSELSRRKVLNFSLTLYSVTFTDRTLKKI